jgi:hypothetical protein
VALLEKETIGSLLNNNDQEVVELTKILHHKLSM